MTHDVARGQAGRHDGTGARGNGHRGEDGREQARPAEAHAGETLPADPLPGEAAAAPFRPSAIRVQAGFLDWDLATGKVACEPATFRLHGLPEDGPAPIDALMARVPAGEREAVASAFRQMMSATGWYQLEYRVTGQDGALRWLEARGHVVAGPDGRPAKMAAVVTDTTGIRAERDAERRRLDQGAEGAPGTHGFTAALASAVTAEDIISAARAGLAAYGASGLVMVADQDGRPAVVASYGFTPQAAQAAGNPEPAPGSPVADAIAGQSAVYIRSGAELAQRYPHLARTAARSGQRAWVAVPVPDSRGRTGACLIGFPGPHEFGAEERALLVAASGLLAQSLERARMHEAEHTLARELQRALLPRGPLTAPGVTVAARYQPATSGMEIGGDFYDVIQLPGGRVALVIGDVQGHNLIAASQMGQLRTVVRAFVREGHGPAEVMTRANQWLAGLNTDLDRALFATCCLVVVDPARGRLAMCRAGHPAPALVTPASGPVLLELGDDLLLGVEPAAGYQTAEAAAPPGATLVLATDGLLDAEGRDPDCNVRSLLRVLAEGAGDDVEELAGRLLASPQQPRRHGDDIALLVARIGGPPGGPLG